MPNTISALPTSIYRLSHDPTQSILGDPNGDLATNPYTEVTDAILFGAVNEFLEIVDDATGLDFLDFAQDLESLLGTPVNLLTGFFLPSQTGGLPTVFNPLLAGEKLLTSLIPILDDTFVPGLISLTEQVWQGFTGIFSPPNTPTQVDVGNAITGNTQVMARIAASVAKLEAAALQEKSASLNVVSDAFEITTNPTLVDNASNAGPNFAVRYIGGNTDQGNIYDDGHQLVWDIQSALPKLALARFTAANRLSTNAYQKVSIILGSQLTDSVLTDNYRAYDIVRGRVSDDDKTAVEVWVGTDTITCYARINDVLTQIDSAIPLTQQPGVGQEVDCEFGTELGIRRFRVTIGPNVYNFNDSGSVSDTSWRGMGFGMRAGVRSFFFLAGQTHPGAITHWVGADNPPNATILAPPALSTAAAPSPTVSGTPTNNAPPATATASAPAPVITAVSVTPGHVGLPYILPFRLGDLAPVMPPAQGTAAAPAPVIAAGATVSAPAATTTNTAPAPVVSTAQSATVLAPVATATASAPAPVISEGTTVSAPAGTATAAAPAPTIAVGVTVTAPRAAATAGAPAPVIGTGTTVSAPAGTATAAAPSPTVATGGSANIPASSAQSVNAAPAPVISTGCTVSAPAGASTAAAPAGVPSTGSTVTAPTSAATAASTAPVPSAGATTTAPAASAAAAATAPVITTGANVTAPAGTSTDTAPAATPSGGATVTAPAALSTNRAPAPVITAGSAISYIGLAPSANPPTFPTHAVGDLLIAVWVGFTTPSTPTNWTSVASGQFGSTGIFYRVVKKIATSTTDGNDNAPNGTGMVGHVYRGANTVGTVAANGGNGNSVGYPAAAFGSTASWAMRYAYVNTGCDVNTGTISGYTNRYTTYNQESSKDTAGAVGANPTAVSQTISVTNNWGALTIEIST